MIENPKPQYAQIAELLRARIEDGTYEAGAVLPSEDRLAEELGVSRVTVNRAVGLLRSSGDVRVKRGVGTTIRTLPQIHRDASARYAARGEGAGAGEVEVRKLNLKSRTDYRRIGQAEPPAAVAKVLGLGAGEPSLLRSRVLYANDEPTQIADSYLPWSVTKDSESLTQPDAGPGGSYGRLAELGVGPVRFTEDVTVRTPTEAEQRTLGLDAAQPVFQIWHVAYTASDRPIEVCIHVMPGYLWTLRYGWDDGPAPDAG
ncbi:GntR family transcriptional regulator [Winogradskya consettensis]|uniref:GntR family transcriptional regulator n=1 Tax=Winogradskya consettensis TaxID=113560 RepID=A0A919T4C6_9ACTN|nr:GntR family transcriptional regulator [Actinoplanes consettensis]GIM83808.1 GntR family transcriptional regulator [Actinoplanes consettensis]